MLIYLIIAGVVCVLILGYLVVEYSVLIPAPNGLPILMYHKVSEKGADGLTVTPDQLDEHFMYLKEKGYKTITFKELKILDAEKDPLPKKTIIITFDDAYVNFRDGALPALKKYNFSATLFIPVAFIGKTNIWDHGNDQILAAADLKHLANNEPVEFGIHSFLHKNYRDMAIEDMEEDLKNCRETLDFYGIPFARVLAYPYGGYPGKDPDLKGPAIRLFEQAGLDFALRIGNRINPWPIRNRFELKRIDIRGTDSYRVFRIKINKGRAKIFA
ncbi:MAG: polysaccharide deacetylase family protein [Saccharofermentanaceae bacterium]|jgi:peptidoglycan/xylan/chitin deacetylase (PgdA/CDA1 family)|nr:polysaccharide deacetylase family protein [Bacteroidales bacterium]